jgi:hypothetical protein
VPAAVRIGSPQQRLVVAFVLVGMALGEVGDRSVELVVLTQVLGNRDRIPRAGVGPGQGSSHRCRHRSWGRLARALARRADGAALDGRRHGGGPPPVPPGQRLAAPARAAHRPGHGCHTDQGGCRRLITPDRQGSTALGTTSRFIRYGKRGMREWRLVGWLPWVRVAGMTWRPWGRNHTDPGGRRPVGAARVRRSPSQEITAAWIFPMGEWQEGDGATCGCAGAHETGFLRARWPTCHEKSWSEGEGV